MCGNSLLVLAVFLLPSGCATHSSSTSALLDQIRQASQIHLVHYLPKQRREASAASIGASAGGVVGLLIGGIVDVSRAAAQRGRSLTVLDAAELVQNGVADALTERHKLTNLHPIGYGLPNDDRDELRKRFGDGFYIDFKSGDWTTISVEKSDYRLPQEVEVRLMQLGKDSDTLWKTTCNIGHPDGANLRASGESPTQWGDSIREHLERGAKTCAAEVLTRFGPAL